VYIVASFPALPLLAKIKLEKLRDRKVWYNLPREQPHAFGWRGRNVDDVDIVGQTAHARFTRVLPVKLSTRTVLFVQLEATS